MPKIETKIRTYDDGLSIMKEITKVITNDDGSVDTKVTTFEIGKRQHHSDYWRSHYASEEEPVNPEFSKEDQMLAKCMNDVARIANTFDNDIKLAYKNKFQPSNDPTTETVLLDPRTAIEDGDIGQKVDVFSGEILLGTALRKQSAETKAAYRKHIERVYDEKIPEVDRAASMLYLAMEADAACEYVKKEAPGFTEYAHARARKYVSDEGSAVLQDNFLQDNPDPGSKFAALIREFDTFGSQPIDYGEYKEVIDSVVSQVRKLPSAEQRLNAARQLAHRYLVQEAGKMEMPTGGSSGDGDKPQQGSPGEPIDMEMLKEMLTSVDMLGKQGDPKDLQNVPDGSGHGFDKPTSPADLMKKNDIGDSTDVPVVLTTNVKSIDENLAAKLFHYETMEVRPISEAIEEALQILNKEETCWDEYSLRSGEIDEGSFHKLVDNSDNVFYKVETLPKMKIQVGLLLDESGSMCCYVGNNPSKDESASKVFGEMHLTRTGVARKLATAFVNGTKDVSGVDMSIYGHAGPKPTCRVFKYIDHNTPESQFKRVSHISGRLHNYDGHAILKTGQDMLDSENEYDRRIMFIISDGEPSVTNYSGARARKHIASVVKHLNESGIETYVIGVDDAFPEDDGEEMYGQGRFIVLPNFDLNEVSTIISSFLEEISYSL